MKYVYIMLALCILALPALAEVERFDAGGLSDVVSDTTPQLGGDIDLNGFDIVDDSQSIIFTSGGKLVAPNAINTTPYTSGFTLGTEHRGIIFTSGTFNVSFSSADNLTTGECIAVFNKGSGTITYQSSGTGETVIPADSTTVSTQYGEAVVCKTDTAEYWVSGDTD